MRMIRAAFSMGTESALAATLASAVFPSRPHPAPPLAPAAAPAAVGSAGLGASAAITLPRGRGWGANRGRGSLATKRNAVTPIWQSDSQTLVYASDCGRGVGQTALYRVTIAR